MVAKVTAEGLIIPPGLLVGIEAVEIRKEKDRITLIPTRSTDPVLELGDRKSTRLNSSHIQKSRMPSSA